MNLLSGSIGVICALGGRPDMAFILMIAAAVFDFADGLAARLLKVVSPLGKELDSLSDMVSFGLLPAVMLCALMFGFRGIRWYAFIPLFLALMSALRLAKFNTDERQSDNFIGLPTPSSAMIAGSFAYFVYRCPDSILAKVAATSFAVPIIAVVLGLLLVSEIPMFGMKIKHGSHLLDAKRIVFLAAAVVILVLTLVLGEDWSLAVLGIFVFYILENCILVPVTR